jgi:predicted nucleic acid-binding protein
MMVVLLDACMLINLFHAGRSDLLAGLTEYDFRLTSLVIDEISDPAQKADLQTLLKQGTVRFEPVTDREVILKIDRLAKIAGRGEASCLALAWKTGWAVGTDDGKARRLNEKAIRPAELLTTPGLILKAIRKGLLTVEEADDIKERLEGKRFIMAFGSFREFVSSPG